MKKVILLNGLPRSGKDTCADYLVAEHGYKKFSFAAALKEIMAITLGVSVEQLEELKNENMILYTLGSDTVSTSVREVLQRFGTEGMKPFFGHDVWAKLLYDKIRSSRSDKIVVSDFRFLVEYQPKEGLDIKTWLIDDGRELPTEGHASDVELYANGFSFDKVVENSERNLLRYSMNIDRALNVTGTVLKS